MTAPLLPITLTDAIAGEQAAEFERQHPGWRLVGWNGRGLEAVYRRPSIWDGVPEAEREPMREERMEQLRRLKK